LGKKGFVKFQAARAQVGLHRALLGRQRILKIVPSAREGPSRMTVQREAHSNRRAVEILEKSLGSDHPTTQTVRKNYARLLAEMKALSSQGSATV
jgi:hypothetical protein